MALIVGFDTEYTRCASEFDLPEPDGRRNRVLSYQFYFLDPRTGREGSLLIPIENGDKLTGRLTLGSLLGKALAFAKREGIIDAIHDRIILAAHFWRADFPSLRDFKKLKKKVDAVRRTYASARRPIPQDIYVNGRRHKLTIQLIDTMLLAPAGHQSLAALGDLLGIEKVELPEGAIERMDELQRDDPDLFQRYALRDAEIAAKWVAMIIGFFEQDLGIEVEGKLPVTLGSAAVRVFANDLTQEQLDDLLGTLSGKAARRSSKLTHHNVSDHLAFFANAYHGGRNETYAVGYFTGHLTDIDLRGAYTTAMAAIRYPDWDGLIETTDLDILAKPDALAIGRVWFRFPASTRFPSLPVRAGDRGLIYPLEGVSYCTGAELCVALSQGADIEVQCGLFVPWKSEARPFAGFTDLINRLRQQHKGTVFERVAKEIGNSLYGKTAQGVANMRGNLDNGAGNRKRRQFNTRSGQMEDLGPSRITQPLLAAFITGLVRAVLSEQLARLPHGVVVLSATTDGFLSTASPDQLDTTSPLISLFSELRMAVSGDSMPIEVKGEASEVISMKTRGAFATKPYDSDNPGKPILARAGIRLEASFQDPWDECREMQRLYTERYFDLKLTQHRMINLRLQWESDADLTHCDQKVRVNLDYDLKRRPIGVTDENGLIKFATEPWQSVEDFHEWRDAFEAWRHKKHRVLKTAQDWQDFLDYKQAAHRKSETGVRTDKRPAVVQYFLRCYAHGELGLPGEDYGAAAQFVTEQGWPTTVQNVKDAKRRGSVKLGVISGPTDDERIFLQEVAQRWPDFDYLALFQKADE